MNIHSFVHIHYPSSVYIPPNATVLQRSPAQYRKKTTNVSFFRIQWLLFVITTREYSSMNVSVKSMHCMYNAKSIDTIVFLPHHTTKCNISKIAQTYPLQLNLFHFCLDCLFVVSTFQYFRVLQADDRIHAWTPLQLATDVLNGGH